MAKKTTKKTTKATKKKGKKKATGSGSQAETLSAPVAWRYPEGQTGQFANHLWVQYDGHEYHLSFFEIKPPLLTSDTADEKRQELEQMGSVDARCVARIVVSAGRMKDFVQTMKGNYERTQGPLEGSTDDDGN